MQTITNEQIFARWEQVPEQLKEAFFSADNGAIIWKVGEEAGLSEDVIDNVLIVVGNVLLGFTHVNDLSKELATIPEIDPKAIDRMVFQIDKRILAPIKSDIVRLYIAINGSEPRIVAERGNSMERASMPIKEGIRETGIAAEAPAPIAEQEKTEVDIRKIRIGEDLQSVAAMPASQAAEAEKSQSVQMPTIIHSEAELQPVAQKRRALSSFGGMFGFRKVRDARADESAVAAQVGMVEVEGVGERKQESAKTEQRPIKVVHYTSAKAPEDIFAKPAQEVRQPQPAQSVPVVKQEYKVDFEPQMINLAHHDAQQTTTSSEEQGVKEQPKAAEEPIVPVPPMQDETAQATIMKTPQRQQAGVQARQQADGAPRLSEIPVSGDVIDLRTLDKIESQPAKKTGLLHE